MHGPKKMKRLCENYSLDLFPTPNVVNECDIWGTWRDWKTSDKVFRKLQPMCCRVFFKFTAATAPKMKMYIICDHRFRVSWRAFMIKTIPNFLPTTARRWNMKWVIRNGYLSFSSRFYFHRKMKSDNHAMIWPLRDGKMIHFIELPNPIGSLDGEKKLWRKFWFLQFDKFPGPLSPGATAPNFVQSSTTGVSLIRCVSNDWVQNTLTRTASLIPNYFARS